MTPAGIWSGLGLDLSLPVAYAATYVLDSCGDLSAPWAWALLCRVPLSVPCSPCLADEVKIAIAAYYGGDLC